VVIAAAAAATNIIEIGTGVCVSGLWLFLRSSWRDPRSIDFELDYQQSAKKYPRRGIPAELGAAYRGLAIDVPPRMNEQSYDIVLCR
jgi:predicted O-methyltransferase YrrM